MSDVRSQLLAILKTECPHCAARNFLNLWYENNPDFEDNQEMRQTIAMSVLAECILDAPREDQDGHTVAAVVMMPKLVHDLRNAKVAMRAGDEVDAIFAKGRHHGHL